MSQESRKRKLMASAASSPGTEPGLGQPQENSSIAAAMQQPPKKKLAYMAAAQGQQTKVPGRKGPCWKPRHTHPRHRKRFRAWRRRRKRKRSIIKTYWRSKKEPYGVKWKSTRGSGCIPKRTCPIWNPSMRWPRSKWRLWLNAGTRYRLKRYKWQHSNEMHVDVRGSPSGHMAHP